VEVKVRKRDKQELQIVVNGEGHSFCVALQNFLLKDDSLEFSGYIIEHPLLGNPVISLRTKGRRRPENALLDAAKSLNKTLEELKKTFLEAMKGEDRSTRNNEE
jgi:DNA-directed RNA polymerase subunit L